MKRLALALALALGCDARTAPTPLRPDTPEAAPVRWVRAAAATELAVWEAPAVARLDGLGRAEVTASVRVRVSRVLVQPGDRVAAGAPVVEVEAPELIRALAARGAAAGRVAPLRRWRVELTAQRETGLVRGADVHEVEARLADAEAELRRAEADLRAAGVPSIDLAALERTGHFALRSPIAGVVRAVNAVPGRIVEPAQGALAEVVGERPARIEVRVLQPWPRGATLRFVSSMGAEVPLDATPLSEVIDPATGGRVAWLRVTGDTPLASGTAGRVVVSGLPADAVVIPSRALLRADGGAWVLRRDGAGTRRVRVEVLSATQHRAVVRGLALGDELAPEADAVTGDR